jgi:alpha-galactosidase
MVSTGLQAAGYTYLNLDDGWASEDRAADGSVVPSPALFPNMTALGDYIHQQGLLFGIYTAENPKTCMGKAGSYKHELQDAVSYCSWGVPGGQCVDYQP